MDVCSRYMNKKNTLWNSYSTFNETNTNANHPFIENAISLFLAFALSYSLSPFDEQMLFPVFSRIRTNKLRMYMNDALVFLISTVALLGVNTERIYSFRVQSLSSSSSFYSYAQIQSNIKHKQASVIIKEHRFRSVLQQKRSIVSTIFLDSYSVLSLR